MAIASALHLYYLSKILELLDSVFFILRGKYNQLSFLHVYHHSTMIALAWFNVNFLPGGNSVVGTLMNCGIHIVMYGYYFLASLGPKIQKYLWWKRYLTTMQIVQGPNLVEKNLALFLGRKNSLKSYSDSEKCRHIYLGINISTFFNSSYFYMYYL